MKFRRREGCRWNGKCGGGEEMGLDVSVVVVGLTLLCATRLVGLPMMRLNDK